MQGSRAVHREAQRQIEAVALEGYPHGLQIDDVTGQIEAGAEDTLVEQEAVEETYRQRQRATGREYDEGAEDPSEVQIIAGAVGEQNDLVGVGLDCGEGEGALDATGQVLDVEIEVSLGPIDGSEAEQCLPPRCIEQVARERHRLAGLHHGRHGSVEAQALEVVDGNRLCGGGHGLRDEHEKYEKKTQNS